ncbi:MAG: ABC transporter substrate-binding protein [Devosia sp.]
MRKWNYRWGVVSLLLGVSIVTAHAQVVEPTLPPEPPKFDAQSTPIFVGVKDILEFKSLPQYHEPEYMAAFEKAGLLPPLAERLPKEPMVFKTGNMRDGIGVYGDVLRHVIGGRPEGWNAMAGQSQGWGGIDTALFECLTRTGPLFQVKAEELEPLPNLAKSWEWSEDGHKLTMHLVEGAKWSDGVPFTSEDVMFFWDDAVMDPNVTPLGGAGPDTFGEGTTLRAIDDYTIEWTFKAVRPVQFLYQMSSASFCPQPAHILKPQHPKYNPKNTYEDFKNAFPADYMNMPVLGAWVVTVHRPDDVVIMRRNPYYWKVDEAGNQLPYLNEMHYKLSTWEARDIEAATGGGDYSNLEHPENYVESLKRSSEPNAPSKLEFGARTIGFSLNLNYAANGWGEPDARGQAVRELNRNLDFRKAISYGIDRQGLGNSLVKGPFTAPYPGGLYPASAFYDRDSTVYYPFSIESAKEYLKRAGLADTDGDGFVNFPASVMSGANVEVVVSADGDGATNRNIAETIVSSMEKIGVRVIPQFVGSNSFMANNAAGQFDWAVTRNGSELLTVTQNTQNLAPVGPQTSGFHKANAAGALDLLPFEEDLVNTVKTFLDSTNPEERVALMKHYQKVYTENVYSVGLTNYAAALVINKRFANVPVGMPVFLFNWGEDSIIRERLYVPTDKQQDYELTPNTIPGKPGKGEGPVSQ